VANWWSEQGDICGLRKEIDGLRQIGGLRKEIDGLEKVSVGSLDVIVDMVDLSMRCDAVVGRLRKEIDGLKKVFVGYLDAMVGKAEHREKHREREEMVYYVFLGLLRFCVGFNFNLILC